MVPVAAKEELRRERMTAWEATARCAGFLLIAGVDEVGRGPLAGPVVAAAVILPQDFWSKGLNDSKKMTVQARERVCKDIQAAAVSYGIGIVSETDIDALNIRQATFAAMKMALEQLSTVPDMVFVDGETIPNLPYPQQAYVQGDAGSVTIAAASVVAKVTRDALMDDYHGLYPQYAFSANKGYGTAAHIQAIQSFGPCPIHRRSFEPIRSLVLS